MDVGTIKSRFKPIADSMPKAISSSLIAFLGATAYVETIRPTYESACNAALDKFEPKVEDNKCGKILGKVGQVITSWDDLYLASSVDAKRVYSYQAEQMALKGLRAEGERCAYRLAEDLLRDARRQLIDVMEEYTGIANNDVLIPDMRERYCQILLGLLIPLAEEQGIELDVFKPN